MATKHIADWQVLLAIVSAQEDLRANSPDPMDAIHRLSASTGQPWKVCLRAIERADRRGLCSYGCTIRWPFLLPKGEGLLRNVFSKPWGAAPNRPREQPPS